MNPISFGLTLGSLTVKQAAKPGSIPSTLQMGEPPRASTGKGELMRHSYPGQQDITTVESVADKFLRSKIPAGLDTWEKRPDDWNTTRGEVMKTDREESYKAKPLYMRDSEIPPVSAAERANWMQPEEFDDRHLDRGFIPPKPPPPKPIQPKPVPPTFAQTAGSVLKKTTGNMAEAGAGVVAPGVGGAAARIMRKYLGF